MIHTNYGSEFGYERETIVNVPEHIVYTPMNAILHLYQLLLIFL